MIRIGELKDPEVAKRIAKVLDEQGISYTFQEAPEDFLALYVSSEEDAPRAFEVFLTFMGIPKPHVPDPQIVAMQSINMGPIVRFILIFCVALFALGYLYEEFNIIKSYFYFSTNVRDPFQDILRGEIWRAWTPMFLHFGILHILFNMFMWFELGKAIEHFHGRKLLLFLVLFIGPLSNIGQAFVTGPRFGGMSGVIYGLVGLLWTNQLFNPQAKYKLPKNDIFVMIGWFFLCMLGLIGNIANTAHGVGLGLGMVTGIAISWPYKHGKLNTKIGLFFLALLFIVISMLVDYWRVNKSLPF
jgi:GlpG protein